MEVPHSKSHNYSEEKVTPIQKRLPILAILTWSFHYPWSHRYELPKLLALPVIMASLACAVEHQLMANAGSDVSKTLVSVLTFLPDLLIISLVAAPWHRSILLGENCAAGAWLPRFGERGRRFFGWLILVNIIAYAAMGLVGGVVGGLVGLFVARTSGTEIQRLFDHTDLFVVVLATALIPYAYLVGRLSLVLPSVATDRKGSLTDAWRLSKRNAWRLTLLVGVIPILLFLSEGWVLSGIDWILEPGTLEGLRVLGFGRLFACVPEIILHYGLLPIQVAILSFSYRELSA